MLRIRLLVFTILFLFTTQLIPYSCSLHAVNVFNELTAREQNITKLGYDPQIEFQSGKQVTKSITIYFHGWNRDKESCKKKALSQSPAIFFNFPDFTTARKAPLSQLSFGQLPDIKPALFVLSAIAASELTDAVNLVGFSRGATVIVNLIGVLNNPSNYQQALALMGIDETTHHKIIAMIEKGTIVLDCPLKNIHEGILRKVQHKRTTIINAPIADGNCSTLYKFWCKAANKTLRCFDNSCTAFLHYFYFPLFSAYKPWREDPFSSLKQWRGLHLTTIIRYDIGDPIVGNWGDAEFFNIINEQNPDRTFLIITDHQGHCSPCTALEQCFRDNSEKAS